MFARLHSMGLRGINAFAVEVEASLTRGLPQFEVVGLPDAAVREARERVRSAMLNCGMEFPCGKIVINMAPADVRKVGTLYDVPFLLALLAVSEQLAAVPEDAAFIGELSLSGGIRPCNGVLAMVLEARAQGFRQIFVPRDNAAEASVVEGIECYAPDSIGELLEHLTGRRRLTPAASMSFEEQPQPEEGVDFSEVSGQLTARRALELAAAGGHNILLIGAPGAGKSMLAKRLPTILPDMTFEESIETTCVHSVAGVLPRNTRLITRRPFCSPHHTATCAALSGGGNPTRPGEISLAHNGVLFLDELPEFSAQAMEILRQPMEDRVITVSRATGRMTFPCSFQLVAAMNPCKCGYFGHPTKPCTCSRGAAERYMAKVSGPLLDRIDIQVEFSPISYEEMAGAGKAEGSAQIRRRVVAARERQRERFSGTGITCNARATGAVMRETFRLTQEAQTAMKLVYERLGLSGRTYDSLLKVARTIADVQDSRDIERAHIMEAVHYRSLEHKYWKRKG